MADVYISTPTQAAYEALMCLAEAKGYHWFGGYRATDADLREIAYQEGNSQVVHLNSENMEITRCSHDYYYEELGIQVETIKNLVCIKAIWKVKPEDLNLFTDQNLNTSDVIKDWALKSGVIILLKNGSYDLGFEEIHKALAVEYNPKENVGIPEKVKLPSFVCEQISRLKGNQGIEKISNPNETVEFMNRLSKMYGKSHVWLSDNKENQWKLIDALRNGYKPESEKGESL